MNGYLGNLSVWVHVVSRSLGRRVGDVDEVEIEVLKEVTTGGHGCMSSTLESKQEMILILTTNSFVLPSPS